MVLHRHVGDSCKVRVVQRDEQLLARSAQRSIARTPAASSSAGRRLPTTRQPAASASQELPKVRKLAVAPRADRPVLLGTETRLVARRRLRRGIRRGGRCRSRRDRPGRRWRKCAARRSGGRRPARIPACSSQGRVQDRTGLVFDHDRAGRQHDQAGKHHGEAAQIGCKTHRVLLLVHAPARSLRSECRFSARSGSSLATSQPSGRRKPHRRTRQNCDTVRQSCQNCGSVR